MGDAALTKFSGIAVKGTFAGNLEGSSGKVTSFSGSWNGGGAIQKF